MFKIIAALMVNFVALTVLSGCAIPATAEPTPSPAVAPSVALGEEASNDPTAVQIEVVSVKAAETVDLGMGAGSQATSKIRVRFTNPSAEKIEFPSDQWDVAGYVFQDVTYGPGEVVAGKMATDMAGRPTVIPAGGSVEWTAHVVAPVAELHGGTVHTIYGDVTIP